MPDRHPERLPAVRHGSRRMDYMSKQYAINNMQNSIVSYVPIVVRKTRNY